MYKIYSNFILGFSFIKRYSTRDFFYIFYYTFFRYQKNFLLNAKFFNNEEFSNQIKNGKSVIRLGDGELGIIHGRDIHYQKYDKNLQKYLLKIVKDYKESSKYVLGIPLFVNCSNKELNKKEGKLSCWLPLKVEYFRRFNKNAKYFDAHLFYYNGFSKSFINNFLQNKNVILVTNKNDIFKMQNSILENKISFKNIEFVETPSEQSFTKFLEIEKETKNKIEKMNKFGIKNEEIKIVFSTGPTSKALVYEFSKIGLQSFDIGFGLRYIWEEKDYSFVI